MIYAFAFSALVLVGLLAILLATSQGPYTEIDDALDTIDELAGDE